MENTSIVAEKLVSNFQQIMPRVWCDNSLLSGLEEVRGNLEQIMNTAPKSREILGQLGEVPAHLEALQKEWDHKSEVLQNFMAALTLVLKQFREERQQLVGK
ncbi:hypothetical protein REC12_24820 [Desulfosporosinus sp. PR]|uniref:hypothetical protein n=1 Tax=Candidatus Desulfosporosinus nitrosoreducens TaxID=3401928 RepID=UPI0027FC8AEE|nr:hypothetical protein [Desulfosporosinus sp. PR]MDQ7096821.1 hypothetical protein [Desulfosporosinus sp. PR]